MYISSRAIVVRNFAIAIVNGTITLIILLIAPVGLAAVVSNTFLVAVASFFTATLSDGVIRFLQASRSGGEIPLESEIPYSTQLGYRSSQDIQR